MTTPLTVACPKCGAPAGTACKRPRSRPGPHLERVKYFTSINRLADELAEAVEASDWPRVARLRKALFYLVTAHERLRGWHET